MFDNPMGGEELTPEDLAERDRWMKRIVPKGAADQMEKENGSPYAPIRNWWWAAGRITIYTGALGNVMFFGNSVVSALGAVTLGFVLHDSIALFKNYKLAWLRTKANLALLNMFRNPSVEATENFFVSRAIAENPHLEGTMPTIIHRSGGFGMDFPREE